MEGRHYYTCTSKPLDAWRLRLQSVVGELYGLERRSYKYRVMATKTFARRRRSTATSFPAQDAIEARVEAGLHAPLLLLPGPLLHVTWP